MSGYLIGEEGPLAGIIIQFEEGQEWVLGRDPDESSLVLEDPLVSRRHAICRLTSEGYVLENLSSVNPATQNGKIITEAVLLQEGDILQVGSTFFRFTEVDPLSFEEPPEEEEEESDDLFEEGENLSSMQMEIPQQGRWLLKVISGPNAGAEFGLQVSSSYTLGKDPDLCDVAFNDLSVSRQHAKISLDEQGSISIEDLGSRNGVLVNGDLITEKTPLSSQDLIAIGTTSFLVIDKEQLHETIISPSSFTSKVEEELPPPQAETPPLPQEEVLPKKTWEDLAIPTKYLIFAATALIAFLGLFAATFSLFESEPVVIEQKKELDKVQEALASFSGVQFSFNEASGKLFLVGHVLTSIDKQELNYAISLLPFVTSIEDTVIIDELVWQNMNSLLLSDPNWQAVSIHSPSPGKFVLRGYVQTIEQAESLADYLNTNFPYLDLLDNQVVVANNLNMQIQSLLTAKGFSGVAFQLSNGELVLSGRVEQRASTDFSDLVTSLKALAGIRLVKNFVVYSTTETSQIDLSGQYQVSGFSSGNNDLQFIVINQKIFSVGDDLDGMQITAIQNNAVLLEKDGIKFRINYNLQ